MMPKDFSKELPQLYGKVIAVVYIFEGEDAKGFEHYHVWRSDVISGWLNAIQALHGLPLILDVRTFVEKAVNRTLPHIDFVLNLNCGSCSLYPMGLVPSVCGFLSIPCIPCDTVSIIAGEDKYLANLIAKARGLRVPDELDPSDTRGIYRPLNYGSSVGVQRGVCPAAYRDGTYQEFIHGYDITTPMVYDPLSGTMGILPTVMIAPDEIDTDWFYGESANKTGTGYHRNIIPPFSDELNALYRDVVRAFSISTFCRIDARIKCEAAKDLPQLLQKPLGAEDVYFLEINSMPSIRNANNDFKYSFEHIVQGSSLDLCLESMKQLWGAVDLPLFLLACSMLSYTKATCKK
ncbi:MAG: hypothetical protein K2P35_07785 [Lachnospiraceae bacterium]|nr:hypothetical protein [Lachnospiraceae bacterium]